jgi:excisionase family DNA binding protein
MSDLPLVLTVEETAKVMRLSRGSTYEAVRTGAIPSVRIGRRVLIPRAALLALLGESPADEHAGREQHADDQRERSDLRGGVER